MEQMNLDDVMVLEDKDPGGMLTAIESFPRHCTEALHLGRDQMDIPSSGSSENPITYQAASGDRPVISGLELVTGWDVDTGSIYKKTFTNTVYYVVEDGTELTRVFTKADLSPGEWYYCDGCGDGTDNTLYVNCTDRADPNSHTMEIANAGNMYYGIDSNDKSYITVKIVVGNWFPL